MTRDYRTLSEALRDVISREARSLDEIADAAGVSRSFLYRLRLGKNIYGRRIERVCTTLGIKLSFGEPVERRVCLHCGVDLQPEITVNWARNIKRLYCSAKCRQAMWWASLPLEERRKRNRRWKANEKTDNECADSPFDGIAVYGNDYPAVG